MGKGKRKRNTRLRAAAREPSAHLAAGGARRARWLAPAVWLHPEEPEGPPWKLLPWVLALAFAARAAVALAGDFVLHPDEIMQYLEPAHRLVFGSGITYWEFFYGARSWLVPGLVAGILVLFDSLGLGEPFWYVGGVKLAFCAVSLLVPAGMYFFARRHFGETAARISLLAGAFWYELAGFAHKPLTEFVATALLLALLALCVRPSVDRARVVWATAALAVLGAAVRLQYAPLALLLLGAVFLQARKKAMLGLAAGAFFLAVGIFDGASWDGGLFHSYVTNIEFNLLLGEFRAGESPGYQYLWWLALASTGIGVSCVAAAFFSPRRYGLLLALIVLTLLAHSLQAHKEYRFVFAVIPLWLLIGSDLVARASARMDRTGWGLGLASAVFAAASAAGILNALPHQDRVYRAYSNETGVVRFLHGQDPVFAAYRHLAQAPGVQGVLQTDRPYHSLPGYYYLHREVPFYDAFTGQGIVRNMSRAPAFASHVVSMDSSRSVPGYRLEQAFGEVRVWRRDEEAPAVRRWENYAPVVTGDPIDRIMKEINPGHPPAPGNWGIRLSE
ncbi:MAG: hypothetical protein OXC38_00045 [Gammaproteobacteria bacterium]|nr:hypothetical protein [Gammaproteobacteria bacterium]